MKAYLGIGTNIGDRAENLKNAVEALKLLPDTKIENVSAVYETEPWGYTMQDNFLNICVKVETQLSPSALLGAGLGIEAAFGRERPFKYSPRVIDIDLLLYEGVSSAGKELMLPHPRIGDRAFVLVPLKDILPALTMNGVDYNEAYNNCDKNGVKMYCQLKT